MYLTILLVQIVIKQHKPFPVLFLRDIVLNVSRDKAHMSSSFLSVIFFLKTHKFKYPGINL